jgi:hypothetical protein
VPNIEAEVNSTTENAGIVAICQRFWNKQNINVAVSVSQREM